jgi:hypothetical protein
VAVKVVGVGHLPHGASCRRCCPRGQLFQRVVAIGRVGHSVPRDSTQAVPLVVGVGEGFSRADVGDDVTRVVVSIASDLRSGVLIDRAQTVVGGAIKLGAVGGGAEERGIVGDAVAHPVIAKALRPPWPCGRIQAVGEGIAQCVAVRRRHVVRDPRQIHAIGIGIGEG